MNAEKEMERARRTIEKLDAMLLKLYDPGEEEVSDEDHREEEHAYARHDAAAREEQDDREGFEDLCLSDLERGATAADRYFDKLDLPDDDSELGEPDTVCYVCGGIIWTLGEDGFEVAFEKPDGSAYAVCSEECHEAVAHGRGAW